MYVCVCVHVYQNKRTPLHLAVKGGHSKIVETLVEAKADLCAQDDDVSVLKEIRLDAFDRGGEIVLTYNGPFFDVCVCIRRSAHRCTMRHTDLMKSKMCLEHAKARRCLLLLVLPYSLLSPKTS